jgi:hypothetical protein
MLQETRASDSAQTFALSEIASWQQILTAIAVTPDDGVIGTGLDLVNFRPRLDLHMTME